MLPRGANGGAQAILDCTALTNALLASPDPAPALAAYEAERRPATARVVLRNRTEPPDAILHEVSRRTGDRPFTRIEDVISPDELAALNNGYKRVAGFDHERLRAAE
jgi:2-polyprenyl-6-methoxyphenol hydroxylase-like FAD-dependent oxidoreductase